MAGKSSHGSPDFNATHNNHQIEREENDPRFIQSFAKVDVPKKKTTFKITSVTKSARPSTLASQRADRSFERGGSGDLLSQSENDLDSLDDLDETVDSHTEDLSSEIFDTNSRLTDPDSQDPFLTPDELVKEIEPKEKPARFKVVKVETKEPFKRGRWVCWDYLDAPDHKTEEVSIKPGSSTATGSVHYVHGIDDPSKNPLLAGASGTMFTHQQSSAAKDSNPSTANTLTEAFKPIQPAQLSSHAGLISDPTFSSYVVQSSVPGMAYTAQAGISPSHSLPLANRLGGPMPVLPPMQQGETQTSQSLSGNIPFPTPDGQSHQLPIPQSSLYPSSGLSQPSAVARSVTSPHQPSVQLQDYVNAVAQVQVAASQDQHVPTYQQQMLYQEISSQPSAYSLNGTPFDGPQLTVNGTSINSLTSLGPEGMQDTRPNLGAGLAQIAVGGMSTAAPGEDDVTEEAFLQYFSNLSAYGSSGLFPPFLEESGSTSAVAIDNKIEQAMDLVKSHLMYAVREEVEVLKEVIKELMERLHKVEQENHLLRSEAAPHTLARLPPPQPPVTHPLLQQFMVSFPPPPPTSAAAAASQQQQSQQSSSQSS